MSRRIFSALLVLPLLHGALLQAAPRDPALANACANLSASAIQKPYGWGWQTTLTQSGDPNAPGHSSSVIAHSHALPPPVVIDLLPTAQRGLLLLLASEINGDPTARHTAIQAARLITAAQEPTGRIPTQVKLGGEPMAVPDHQAVPDRQTTVAALGFLLAIDAQSDAAGSATSNSTASPAPPSPSPATELTAALSEQIHRSAQRAAYWLVRQQAHEGGWPDTLSTDAAAIPGALPPRLMLLDRPHYRDCTLALLMAANAFNDAPLHHQAAVAIKLLCDSRISPDAPAGVGLWHSAETFDGRAVVDPANNLEDPNRALRLPDLLASKFAVETLAASYLLADDNNALTIANHATDAMAQLRNTDGTWTRFTSAGMSRKPPPKVDDVFGAQPTISAPPPVLDLAPTIAAINALRVAGPDNFVKHLHPPLSLNQRFCLTLAGLADFPLNPALRPYANFPDGAPGATDARAILSRLAEEGNGTADERG